MGADGDLPDSKEALLQEPRPGDTSRGYLRARGTEVQKSNRVPCVSLRLRTLAPDNEMEVVMTNAEWGRRAREAAKLEGLCIKCRRERPRVGVFTCDGCLAKIKSYPKSRRAIVAKQERSRRGSKARWKARREQGKCGRCGKREAHVGRTMCEQCLDANLTRWARTRYLRVHADDLQRWADDGGRQ